MPHPAEAKEKETKLTRKQLIEALNETCRANIRRSLRM
jgi:hypothetical protein